MPTVVAAPPPVSEKISASLETIRQALADYLEQPEASLRRTAFLDARRTAAAVVAAFSPSRPGDELIKPVRTLREELAQSGAMDQPAESADLKLADDYGRSGWPGLLAAMLLTPAWQWPSAPPLEKTPSWMWGEYAAYLFYAPQGFCACGQAEAYAAHYLRRLEELARLGRANPGSAAVRSALRAYCEAGNCIPLYFSAGSLRRHYELRGRILALAAGVKRQEEIFPPSREGRRLRVGFINRHFGPQTETYTTLPTFEHLDPERFEVRLFACRATESALEDYARKRAAGFTVLPADLNEQLQVLRAASLDVAVFGTNVTAIYHEVTQLALHRVAPLQVVNNSSCTTTGLPEIDLYVSGDRTESPAAPEHFSERLGLLPGPAHAFNYEADRQEPTTAWTRASLGIPEDAVVFVTAANYFKIIPEMQQTWARLLAGAPGSRLLVHPFNPNWSSSYPIKRFCAEFDRVLAQHGVGSDRLIMSTARFPSRTDVKELLRVGDIYLDTFPFGGVNSLIDPLEIGLPVVVWEGETFRSRMGAALLRTLGLEEWVAHDETSYQALAGRLAARRTLRAELGDRIRGLMQRVPLFLDSLAQSDAFGDLLETAFDQIGASGGEQFRAARAPLQAARPTETRERLLEEGGALLSEGDHRGAQACARAWLRAAPADPEARHLYGRALLAAGRPQRALDYLLAAVQAGAGAAVWHDLALALHALGRHPEALQALETSLRIEGNRVEAWLLLAQWAREVDHEEMAVGAEQVIAGLVKEDRSLDRFLGQPAAAAAL